MRTTTQDIARLVAEFEELSRRLISVTEVTERGKILEEMRAMLRELRAAAEVKERELPV